MAVVFKELRIRNFLSYGNSWTKYQFKEGLITRIAGKNGQGKSAILDGLYYGLFGKPYRNIKIGTLVNNTNKKGLEVELTLNISGVQFVVNRGIKPGIFTIKKEGELIAEDSTKRGYQETFEEILGFDENIFNQISIKSLTKYSSFLSLNTAKKRELVENIFGLELLSTIKDLNKVELDDINTFISALDAQEDKFKMLIQQEEENLLKLRRIQEQLQAASKLNEDKKLAEIEDIKNQLKKYQKGLDLIAEKEGDKSKLTDIIKELDKKKTDLKLVINELVAESVAKSKQISFLKQNCGDCENIACIEKNQGIGDLKKEQTEAEKARDGFTASQDALYEKIDTLDKTISKKSGIKAKIDSANINIKRINTELAESKKKVDVDIDETKYQEFIEKLDKIKNKLSEKHTELKYSKAIQTMLKDDGIRSYIVTKYLPLLNKILNSYLVKFGIDLELEFTPEFDIAIVTKFKEHFSYQNFSEGEKKRIDASIMFTFLDFCSIKHSNTKTNILILDEFTTSLDPDGENVLFEILRDFSEERNIEVITITHSSLIDPERIDRVFEVSMLGGFSQFEKLELT